MGRRSSSARHRRKVCRALRHVSRGGELGRTRDRRRCECGGARPRERRHGFAPPPATCCPHSRFRAGANVAHGQRNLGSRRHSGNGHVGTYASNVACWPKHYQHDMPKTGGGRFRGMNCATSKTRHLAPTLASHGFQRKQANVDCQSGWVNSERSLYRLSSTRHASKRTLISTERASGRQEERAKAIIQSRDLLQVPWGAGLPGRILCFSTRGLVPDRRREESTQTVLSWDVAAGGGRIERWARGSSGTWRILGDLRLASCLDVLLDSPVDRMVAMLTREGILLV